MGMGRETEVVMSTLTERISNRILTKKGLTTIRKSTLYGTGNNYIPAKETVSAANRDGISVCDYVEKLWGMQGDTQRVIDQMELFGAFAYTDPVIVEIGTGTGRYLEKILLKCDPTRYESYEIAHDWAEWLHIKYKIISHDADGVTLKQTPDMSANLVHAHGTFVNTPFFVSFSYWKEIWRITKVNGMVIFDILSEDCLDEPTLEKWLKSKLTYPYFLSKNFVVSLFNKHGFSLENTFLNPAGEGQSEYLIFTRGNWTD